ncbi:hypothetical protein, partial [Citrobacter youngae]|uniref:hypothetical protein n=1 Tax=Citrobacter youngae TaxID=133448 RepID=UPI0019539CAF
GWPSSIALAMGSGSFGSNLRTTFMFAKNRSTSFNLMEIFFSILLCISGIVLFLIYLNEKLE